MRLKRQDIGIGVIKAASIWLTLAGIAWLAANILTGQGA
jgi:hypothetical protein